MKKLLSLLILLAPGLMVASEEYQDWTSKPTSGQRATSPVRKSDVTNALLNAPDHMDKKAFKNELGKLLNKLAGGKVDLSEKQVEQARDYFKSHADKIRDDFNTANNWLEKEFIPEVKEARKKLAGFLMGEVAKAGEESAKAREKYIQGVRDAQGKARAAYHHALEEAKDKQALKDATEGAVANSEALVAAIAGATALDKLVEAEVHKEGLREAKHGRSALKSALALGVATGVGLAGYLAWQHPEQAKEVLTNPESFKAFTANLASYAEAKLKDVPYAQWADSASKYVSGWYNTALEHSHKLLGHGAHKAVEEVAADPYWEAGIK